MYRGGVRRFVVALAVLAACRHEPGPPKVQRLPKPDGSPALRGGGSAKSPRNANYRIEARLDAARHTIAGSETLTWTNTGASAVDKLPFHLYLNAFKNESSLFMRSSRGEMRGATASDTGWGWIQVDSLQIAGTEYAPKLVFPNLPDETVAEVPLAQPVAPGQTIEIAIKFDEQLPEVFARTGYKGEFHMVGQWFPKIGVRTGPPGAEQWECQPFHANSEFFADFGTYDVTLTVPSTETVAATGVLVAAADAGGLRTLTYHADDVHDFAWMADPYMKMMSGQAKVEDGTVEVRVYARPEQREFARRHLEAAIGAIEKFSSYFLPYPWATMTVIDPPVDAAAGAGGMEYPTLVTTEGDSVFARPGIRIPEYVTVHEVGHNWFQGMLASDEPEEAWLDEGVNEWADAHVMADLYGPHASLIDWGGWQADVASVRTWEGEAIGDPSTLPSPIATAAYAFVDNENYGISTYTLTMDALTTLEKVVGTTKFMAAMKAYARAFAFKHPTGRDLYATLEQQLGQDLGWFFGPVFQKVGGIHLALRTATCWQTHKPRGVFGAGSAHKTVSETDAPDTGAYTCEIVVTSTGVVHVPVEVELRFADGSAQRLTWDDKGDSTWQRFVVERSSKLTEVRLDPEHKILLDSPVLHAQRISGDGSASLRAAARASWWTQSLMELVGP